MQTYHVGLISLALFALLGLFAFWSWVRKTRKQEALLPAPELVQGEPSGQKALYVATTYADRPLDRVVAHGLAHRGNAAVFVAKDGVSIYRTGENNFFIPLKALVGIGQNSTVIDRAVEKDGLTSIRWVLGDTELETHLRFVGATERAITLTRLNDLVG